MIPAALPPDESSRLRVLRLYRILDTACEKAFDNLTDLAASICEAPISLVSLVDEHRQWFKAHHGLEATETPRDWAFCAYAILQDGMLVIPDALEDPRFLGNPLVTGEPRIRFYAGAQLRVESGHTLGTLCVIDRRPRTLSESQRHALDVLAAMVVDQLELRRALADLEQVQQVLPICAWCRKVHGPDGRWSSLDDYVHRAVRVSHGMCPDCRSFAEGR